ncbi:MAG: hypothetical protein HY810_06365 [Candidatus Omnitrophica bacterium]|nr:hypothetical protein [Candidatus Omnitrophota bacterium]
MSKKYYFPETRLKSEKGSALILFFLSIFVLTVLFVSFMSRSISNNRAALRYKDALQSYYLCDAGIDQVKRELFDLFSVYYAAQGQASSSFGWFDDLATDPSGKYPGIPVNASLTDVPGGTYTVAITNVDTSVEVPKDVTVLATAQVNGVIKTTTAVIRYAMSPSRVFDYAYFINNFGWFWGGGITSQGDVRSNGDFDFNGNPTVNGDKYASINPELGAAGTITGNIRNDTLNFYRTQADSTARPTDPTADPQDVNGDGVKEEFPYESGYSGTSEAFPSQQLLDLPFLGDLGYYKGLAAANNGKISQSGVTLVNNVLNGNIVLIGTEANPIEIDGPVVVTGDLLIKGKIKGQGTVYSGRNTHILGDLQYADPPAWPKPDIDPNATDAINANKDFLGLAAKGNIVIGDYTRNDWKTTVSPYLKPPFTKEYKVEITDNTIGYVQYFSAGEPYFNGDYTANDGGNKADGSARKFYESSYSDAYIQTVAENSSQINRIDAVTYTNHMFAGKIGAFTINGSMVARDEAMIYSGNLTLNYDLRAKYKGGQDFYLPRALALPHTQYFKRD